MSGDEFVVLLASIQLPEHAALLAEKIRVALSRPFDLADQALSPSIGIAHYPEHGNDGEELVRRADMVMHGAKQEGGNRFKVAEETSDVSRTIGSIATE